MAVAKYYTWEAQGRPWHACTPIQQFSARLKAALPGAIGYVWTLGDTAHLTSDFPQDHTPFSFTGWPNNSPYPVVFACAVSHQPARGVDCFALFKYWLAEAKAGRMPWLKYMIWQAKRYDVRNKWLPVNSTGHLTHIHLSARTDYTDESLGTWSPVPVPPEPEVKDQDMAVVFSWQGKIRMGFGPVQGYKTMADTGMYGQWRSAYCDPPCYPDKDGNGFPTQTLEQRGWTADEVAKIYGRDLDDPAPAPVPGEYIPHTHTVPEGETDEGTPAG